MKQETHDGEGLSMTHQLFLSCVALEDTEHHRGGRGVTNNKIQSGNGKCSPMVVRYHPEIELKVDYIGSVGLYPMAVY